MSLNKEPNIEISIVPVALKNIRLILGLVTKDLRLKRHLPSLLQRLGLGLFSGAWGASAKKYQWNLSNFKNRPIGGCGAFHIKLTLRLFSFNKKTVLIIFNIAKAVLKRTNRLI